VEAAPLQRGTFSEKEFYLAEFRGRALGLVLEPGLAASALDALEPVLADLANNGTLSILIGADAGALERVCGKAVVEASDPRWIGALWHALRSTDRVALLAGAPSGVASCAREAAIRLRLAKLVWLSSQGGLERPAGGRLSYVDQSELDETVRTTPERAGLLEEIGAMLAGGLPSVAICAPSALGSELFTYAGGGTFFTRERYIEVRPLGLDEFDRALDLIRRGVEEGFLVPRTEAQLEEVLTNAFGVFVERRYLAGIGALIPHPSARAGELGSLYTLTRFAGEGVGGHLIAHARRAGAEQGFRYLYACTTQPRVVRFFEQHGFAVVAPDAIPPEKWAGYPEARRAQVTCLRHDLEQSERGRS
jgi:N-acetylglutamate synthase-like GNAT family acetyltransferase